MLALKNLVITRQNKIICDNLTLDILKGECWVVLGKNGVGKTTFLKTIAGLFSKKSGDILVNNQSICSLNPIQRALKIGLVLQDNYCEFPVSVREYISHGLYPIFSSGQYCDRNRVDEILDKTALSPLSNRAVNTLSGGELQRAALATILLQSPVVTLLDEPLNSLDLQYQSFMLNMFIGDLRNRERSLILSLHDINVASKYADKVILMWGDGKVSFGLAEELMSAKLISELYGVKVAQHNFNGKRFFYTE